MSAFFNALSKHFGELHLGPELNQVNDHEAYNDDTENEHVLRSPFYRFWTSADSVGIVTAGLLVLIRKPESVDDVNDETGSKHSCANQRIPIRAKEFADDIIGTWPEYCYCVHQHVECYE